MAQQTLRPYWTRLVNGDLTFISLSGGPLGPKLGGDVMKKHILAAAALTAWAGGSAIAADIPVKAPLPAPIPVFSWTGCFIGTHTGGMWVKKDYTVDQAGSITYPVSQIPGEFAGDHRANSYIFGGQVGCDYQAGAIVFGLQGDGSLAKAVGDHHFPFILSGPTSLTDQSETKSLVSATARLGVAWNRALFYIRGGGAWERDSYSRFVSLTDALVSSASETRTGWIVGVGAEIAVLPNLSAFLEFDHYDFGTRGISFYSPTNVFDGRYDIKERKDVFRGGFNWRFGAPAQAVQAAY